MINDSCQGASPINTSFDIQWDIFSYYPCETWKPVVGFEGIYAVSSLGRVRRLTASSRSPGGNLLQPILNSTGYYYVNLCNRSKKAIRYIHQLVAEAFFGQRPPQHHTNHKDGDKTNNCLLNLEYVTVAENVIHGGVVGSNKHVWLTPDIVRQIRVMHSQVKSYKIVGDHFGVDQAHVYRIVTRQSWKHVD